MNLIEASLRILGGSFILWFFGEILNELSVQVKSKVPRISDLFFGFAIVFFMAGAAVTIPVSCWLHRRMDARIKREYEEESMHKLRDAESKISIAKSDGIKLGSSQGYKKGFEDGTAKASEETRLKCYGVLDDILADIRTHAVKFMEPFHSTPAFLSAENYSFLTDSRLYSTLKDSISYAEPAEIRANIIGTHGDIYQTTLYDCTCPDYCFRHKPCKHMFYLAIDMGMLSTLDTAEVQESLSALGQERERTEKEKQKTESAINRLEHLKQSLSIRPESFPESLEPPKNMWLPRFKETDDRKKCCSFISLYEWGRRDRYQLALNAWQSRKKTRPQIGLAFERFVGYQYEVSGYAVLYNGAESGKEDSGCDLIVFSQDRKRIRIIQCKYWASSREIHENIVTQLYGSVALFRAKHPDTDVVGILVSSCPLSDEAKRAISYFPSLSYVENHPADLQHYPCVKCATGTSGEMYFYLPFDKFYDSVVADCYVSTVAEAMKAGYRRPIC